VVHLEALALQVLLDLQDLVVLVVLPLEHQVQVGQLEQLVHQVKLVHQVQQGFLVHLVLVEHLVFIMVRFMM
jgi:hypothetical protein